MEELLAFLLRELASRYRGDPTAPGVVMATLTDGYYVSICRYHAPGGGGKVVMHHATDRRSLLLALVGAGSRYFSTDARDSRLAWEQRVNQIHNPMRYVGIDFTFEQPQREDQWRPLTEEQVMGRTIRRRSPAEVEVAMRQVSEANKAQPAQEIAKKVEEAAKKAEEAAKKLDRFELIELE